MFILVGSVGNAMIPQVMYHAIQRPAPHFLEQVSFAKPFYQGGTDGVVCMDECPSVPSRAQRVVAETAECPDLGAVVGAVNTGGNVAAVTRIFGSAAIPVFSEGNSGPFALRTTKRYFLRASLSKRFASNRFKVFAQVNILKFSTTSKRIITDTCNAFKIDTR